MPRGSLSFTPTAYMCMQHMYAGFFTFRTALFLEVKLNAFTAGLLNIQRRAPQVTNRLL